MPRIFAVNENNDIYATLDNRLAIAEGINAVAQNVQQVVQTRFTEVYFDRTRGVDYLGLVFGQNPNLLQWEAEVRNVVLGVEDVTNILEFDYEVNENTVTYNMTIQTTFGEESFSGTI